MGWVMHPLPTSPKIDLRGNNLTYYLLPTTYYLLPTILFPINIYYLLPSKPCLVTVRGAPARCVLLSEMWLRPLRGAIFSATRQRA